MCPGGNRAVEGIKIVSFNTLLHANLIKVKMRIYKISLIGKWFVHSRIVSMLKRVDTILLVSKMYCTAGLEVLLRHGRPEGRWRSWMLGLCGLVRSGTPNHTHHTWCPRNSTLAGAATEAEGQATVVGSRWGSSFTGWVSCWLGGCCKVGLGALRVVLVWAQVPLPHQLPPPDGPPTRVKSVSHLLAQTEKPRTQACALSRGQESSQEAQQSRHGASPCALERPAWPASTHPVLPQTGAPAQRSSAMQPALASYRGQPKAAASAPAKGNQQLKKNMPV